MAIAATSIEAADELAVNAARFGRHLRASGLSPKTETTYLEGVANVANVAAFPRNQAMPTMIEGITSERQQRPVRPTTVLAVSSSSRQRAPNPSRPSATPGD